MSLIGKDTKNQITAISFSEKFSNFASKFHLYSNMTATTSYRKELRERILDTAMECFLSRGLRAVKMDDIATTLGISKRTLYEIFENKEVLLLEGMKRNHDMKVSQLRKFVESNCNNVMDVLLEFYRYQVEELSNVSPEFFSEIKRYPRIQEYFDKERSKDKENARKFFMRGIEEGFFRSDVNYEIVTTIFKMGITNVMESGMIYKYSLPDMFSNFIMVFFRGICTDKGLEALKTFNLDKL